MAILHCGNSIRLIGSDAEIYLADTGRATLPRTVDEYNRAMQVTKAMWERMNTPESVLLAACLFKEIELLP
jgi:hypothetical protein